MLDMTQSELDSAMPTSEPANAERSWRYDPGRTASLALGNEVRSSGVRPRAEKKRERARMPWLGWRGGWRQKGWKGVRDKQGDPTGTARCFMALWPEEPSGGSQSIHNSDEAG